MQRKHSKNFILQRLEYYANTLRGDPYIGIDEQQALKMSILDEISISPYVRSHQANPKKNKPKNVIEQINTYLKSVYHLECHSELLKSQLRPLITDGALCDANLNWVVLEVSGARVARRQNPGYFSAVLAQRHLYPADLFEPILLVCVISYSSQDVVRTISTQSSKRKEQEANIEQVLAAYAIRNPVIGYCQGQNFVVHFLVNVMKFDIEDSFWIYVQLLETIMPLDYYTNIISVLTDHHILEYYVSQYLPDLAQHFEKIHLRTDFFAVQWYLCIFTNQTCPKLSAFVLLMLLLDGIQALTISSLILLMLLKHELLKFTQFTEAIQYIQEFTESRVDVDVFRHYYNCIKIEPKAFGLAREAVRTKMMNKHQQVRLTEKQSQELDKIPPCNPDSPICQQVQLSLQFLKRSPSFFVYRTKCEPQVIPDYFDRNIYPETTKTNEPLVLRQTHTC